MTLLIKLMFKTNNSLLPKMKWKLYYKCQQTLFNLNIFFPKFNLWNKELMRIKN